MERRLLKPSNFWLVSNYGNPWAIYRTRKDAIASVVTDCGQPWSDLKKNFEIRKVRIVEGWR